MIPLKVPPKNSSYCGSIENLLPFFLLIRGREPNILELLCQPEKNSGDIVCICYKYTINYEILSLVITRFWVNGGMDLKIS